MTIYPIDVAITGMGMVSALGFDVHNACAAARCGLVRAYPLDSYPVVAPDDGSVETVVVHCLPELTHGFEGAARLLRLAAAALADLERQVPERPWDTLPTGFYLSLGHPSRKRQWLPLVMDEEERKDFENQIEEEQQEQSIDASGRFLIQKAATLNRWRTKPQVNFVSVSGRTGVAEAVKAAATDLAAGKVELAVVCAVDSLIDENLLSLLEITGRLKTPDMATGFQPGEAAGCLLLESGANARQRGAMPLAAIDSVAEAHEKNSLVSGIQPTGEGLTEVIAGLIKTLKNDAVKPLWVISDHNGETYRAAEWGHGLFRLCALSKTFSDPVVWYPVAAFGETMAAGALIAICQVVCAFSRQYAPADRCVITSSCDGPERAGILVRAA